MQKYLIVVDMQKDFINGALGTKEAQAIVPKVIEKIKKYKEDENAEILITQDTHFDNYLETQEGKNLPIKHCIKDTDGWKLQEEVQKELQNVPLFSNLEGRITKYEKPTFGSINLWDDLFCDYLTKQNDDFFMDDENIQTQLEMGKDVQIEIVGLCTDICVLSNAIGLKANLPEAKIIVDSECCAGTTPENHKAALIAMKSNQIEII
jgi:nicotinamidase-related amidase